MRGVKELLLTSDNWEGLRYGGMEGGNKEKLPLSQKEREKNIENIFAFNFLIPDFDILIVSVLKTVNLQRLSFGAIQHLADLQVGELEAWLWHRCAILGL